MSGITPDADIAVAVSSGDTCPQVLDDKLVAGPGITLTILNPGAIEQLRITATAADAFANALFDEDCNPLFSKDEDGTVELLEACT